MVGHNLPADGQTQPRAAAFVFRGKERLKEPGLVLGRDAGSVVGHLKAYPIFGRQCPDMDFFRPAPARHCVAGVVDQVDKHLLKLLKISVDGRQALRHFADNPDSAGLVQFIVKKLKRGAHHFSHTHGPLLYAALAYEEQKILYYLAAAHRALVDKPDILAVLKAGVGRKKLRVTDNALKRIIKLVRDTGNKPPDRG